MKNILIIATVLFTATSFAQNFIAENIEHKNVLYRGFENKLNLGQIGCNDNDYEIKGIGCTVSKATVKANQNLYTVKVNRGAKSPKIYFMSNAAITDSLVFVVKNLPKTSIVGGILEYKNVLYRGYENKLNLGQIGCNDGDYEIKSVGCTISKATLNTNPNLYTAKVNSGAKSPKIYFISNGTIIDSVEFVVKNLPLVSLFWGKKASGTDFSNSREIFVQYTSGETFLPDFEIISWKSHHKAEKFNGNGSLISPEMLAYTNSMVTGETIHIEVKIKNTGGTISTLKGSWVK